MTEGLVWLALLGVFIGLAGAGWVEYRKVEAYRIWAQAFERTKYDIYAVLGQQEQTLTWGKPTPKGPIDLQCCDICNIESVEILVDGQPIDIDHPSSTGKQVQLSLHESHQNILIPFTDVSLAVEWAQYLIKVINP